MAKTSEGGAYAILYSILCIFTILAFLSTSFISTLIPNKLRKCICLSKAVGDGSDESDYFLSARNSASALTIALSFFASGMGAWVVYGTTEMGANPDLSWLGVIGYSGASAIPAILISYLGPNIRTMTNHTHAFSTTDFTRIRYGRVMQLVVVAVSCLYMFIYLVAELTAISTVYESLVESEHGLYARSIAISIGVVTVFYTTIGGLPASIVTDKIQAIVIAVLVIVLLCSVTTLKENRVSSYQFDQASNWTLDGFMACITLSIAIACAELFNQGTWQRVWAAKSDQDMHQGFLLGSVLVFFLMMFFGIMGMIAYAKNPQKYDDPDEPDSYYYLSFFDLLEDLSNFWNVLVLILVTTLAASSIDSLQNALACIFTADLKRMNCSPVWITRMIVMLINIPAIFLSSKGYNMIELFLVADLVCATSVFPVFLGLQTSDKYRFLPAPTELGAFCGCLAGIVTVISNGYINNVNDSNPFNYFWLPNEDICALCGSKTMVTFIMTPTISLIFTYIMSWMDIFIRGERARAPIFNCRFDQEDVLTNDDQLVNDSDNLETCQEVNDSEYLKTREVDAESMSNLS